MQMHQIRYFLVLAEELNFTRSAARCNVAQPSLTRAIKALEEELGGPLFHREHSHTRLTELGKIVRPYLEDVHRGSLPLYRERFVVVTRPDHRFAGRTAVRVRELDGECYLARTNCEYDAPATRIFEEQRADCETVYESERDDWILAMAAAGIGFGFMPELSARHPGVIAFPLIEPEFWREVALVTVRGRQYSSAVGSLVREAMRKRWNGAPALAVATTRAAHAGRRPERPRRAAAK
jgi:DNA-binding transcriptional LysR family regulator